MVEEKKSEGLKIPYTQKVAWDMSELYMNKNSVLHCDKCHGRLGMFHTLRYALFKKPGVAYFVICKECHHPNHRVKGALKQKLERQWDDVQRRE